MGQFSRFVRPGMNRLIIDRSDNMTDLEAAQQVMLSAYMNDHEIVVVAINYTNQKKSIEIAAPGKQTNAAALQNISARR